MAFYEQELAKLNRKVDILAKKSSVVFSEEDDRNLEAHPDVAGHLSDAPVVDNVPKPNSIAPGVSIPELPHHQQVAELHPYVHADGDFAQDGDPYGIQSAYTGQAFQATDARPEDGVPNEEQTVIAAEIESE